MIPRVTNINVQIIVLKYSEIYLGKKCKVLIIIMDIISSLVPLFSKTYMHLTMFSKTLIHMVYLKANKKQDH